MYTHMQCPICTANGVKDEHYLQIFRARDLYEEPFLKGLDLYNEEKQKFMNPVRAYCGYCNNFVSDWFTTTGDLYPHLYDAPRCIPTGSDHLSLSILTRMNIPNVRLQCQVDYALSPIGVFFIKAIFSVRSGTAERFGYYLFTIVKHGTQVRFVNCQEANTGEVQTTFILSSAWRPGSLEPGGNAAPSWV